MYVQVNVMRDWFQKFINSIIIGFTIGADSWCFVAQPIQIQIALPKKTCCFESFSEFRKFFQSKETKYRSHRSPIEILVAKHLMR